ncbi:MAG: AIM24 family protein [Lachnospiraceae bacterium]|nr:AIM24 family protein [Lachnospiraceae bacterium]
MGTNILNLLDNKNVEIVAENEQAGVTVIKMLKDLSLSKGEAVTEYYASKMNICKRQVIINLNNNKWTVSAGAMQVMVGNISVGTGVKSAGDLMRKAFGGAVTGERGIKPEYTGDGVLILEPTYKHIIIEDLRDWGGAMVMNDGYYYASVGLELKTTPISSVSGALLGGEGLFNLGVHGNGVCLLESPRPREELVTIELDNDVLKIDGNYAVCWSPSLNFTVERTTKTLVGSAASGEGLVNVYRGTGRVMMALV